MVKLCIHLRCAEQSVAVARAYYAPVVSPHCIACAAGYTVEVTIYIMVAAVDNAVVSTCVYGVIAAGAYQVIGAVTAYCISVAVYYAAEVAVGTADAVELAVVNGAKSAQAVRYKTVLIAIQYRVIAAIYRVAKPVEDSTEATCVTVIGLYQVAVAHHYRGKLLTKRMGTLAAS